MLRSLLTQLISISSDQFSLCTVLSPLFQQVCTIFWGLLVGIMPPAVPFFLTEESEVVSMVEERRFLWDVKGPDAMSKKRSHEDITQDTAT